MWYFSKPHKVLFKKQWFDEMLKVSFEDGQFNVPIGYHDILTQEYGDYMQLPPVEKRIYQHQYKAYKK
jgi:O-antigen ligase